MADNEVKFSFGVKEIIVTVVTLVLVVLLVSATVGNHKLGFLAASVVLSIVLNKYLLSVEKQGTAIGRWLKQNKVKEWCLFGIILLILLFLFISTLAIDPFDMLRQIGSQPNQGQADNQRITFLLLAVIVFGCISYEMIFANKHKKKFWFLCAVLLALMLPTYSLPTQEAVKSVKQVSSHVNHWVKAESAALKPKPQAPRGPRVVCRKEVEVKPGENTTDVLLTQGQLIRHYFTPTTPTISWAPDGEPTKQGQLFGPVSGTYYHNIHVIDQRSGSVIVEVIEP